MSTREPIDLRRRQLAREMEQELGGLFGIERADIEAAIERLHLSLDSGDYVERYGTSRLPRTVERVIQCLDLIHEIARQDADDTDLRMHILELIDHYRERIEATMQGPEPSEP